MTPIAAMNKSTKGLHKLIKINIKRTYLPGLTMVIIGRYPQQNAFFSLQKLRFSSEIDRSICRYSYQQNGGNVGGAISYRNLPNPTREKENEKKR
jgi:hypothetical protein